MELLRRSFKAMGSPCELRLYGRTATHAEAVIRQGVAEIARLEAKYSRYRDDSLATRINRSAGDAGGVDVDDETAALLDYAQTAFEQSNGLFDVTSGVLRAAWDFGSGELPSQDRVAELLPKVGWQRVDWKRPRIVLQAGMQIDFGGYVKEYTADRVAELCRCAGIRHGLVNLGGDIAAIGPHPDGSPWRVGVQHPRRAGALAVLPLFRGGIASSGDYERFMLVDGVRYCHILDPRTGWPVESMACVSVVADHALVAGTATTIAMLKGNSGGALWLDELGLPNLRMAPDGTLSGTLSRSTAAAAGAIMAASA